MPLMTFQKCWRNRDDCSSFQAIEGMPEGLTEEQMDTLDFEPVSFVCCGLIREDARKVPQDAYRVCFKNPRADEMSNNDEQDLAHLVQVITHAQAVIATRRVHQESLQVLTDDGGMRTVPSIQGSGDPYDWPTDGA